MTLHHFDPNNNSDDADWWKTVYVSYFPDYVSHTVVKDVERQKRGIDHVVTLTGGRDIFVDVKTREKFYHDVLFEIWSAEETNTPGWLRQQLHCHYIAYAWPKRGLVMMIPFHQMRRAYEKNKNRWGQQAREQTIGVREVRAQNVGYQTVSLAVPIEEFQRSMIEAMEVQMDNYTAQLQLEFEHRLRGAYWHTDENGDVYGGWGMR